MSRFLMFALLPACGGSATWEATIWGEDYIEVGIGGDAFADDCSATFSSFQVMVTDVALLDGSGESVSDAWTAQQFDVQKPGPQNLGSFEVPDGHYDTVRFAIGPSGSDPAIVMKGDLTCGGETRPFDLTYDTSTTYLCEPEGLTLAKGGVGTTELTVHGDHLFYDGLTNPDAEVRGIALFDAGETIDHAALAGVSVADLGYEVGPYSEVTDLDAFVEALTRTFGHVDGEGHCEVSD